MNKLRIVGVAAGLVLVSGIVLQVSSAAFTGSTDNSDNSWDAGTVTLTDNDAGSALFTATNQKPGDTATECIEVTYGGSITPSAAVDLFAAVTEANDGTGNGLGDDLDVVLQVGAAGSSCAVFGLAGTEIYNGTLAAFNTSATPLSTGWTPVVGGLTPDTMRPFQFTVTLGSDTPNDAQGDGADADFTWSATS